MKLTSLAVAALAAAVAQAFKPTLEFNLTLSGLAGPLSYKPRFYRQRTTLPSATDGRWMDSFTETDMATFQPGDVGQGQAQRHGVAPKSGAVWMEMQSPHRAIYVYGSTTAQVDGTLGLNSYVRLSASYESSVKGQYVNASGPFVLSLQYGDMNNHSSQLWMANHSPDNVTEEVIVDRVDVTLGIETTATSFDSMAKRVEPFNLNGGENPFFLYETGVSRTNETKGNITFADTPANVAVASGLGVFTCAIPPGTALVTVAGWTSPNAVDAGVSFNLYPPPPLRRFSTIEQYLYTSSVLYSNFSAPVLAYMEVLDPAQKYTLEIISLGAYGEEINNFFYESSILESVTFYSSSDKVPEGGGATDAPTKTFAAPSSSQSSSTEAATRTAGPVIGSTFIPGATGTSASDRSAAPRWLVSTLVAVWVGLGTML